MHEVMEAPEVPGEHAESDPFVIHVAVTMAILAVLVALATLAGHRSTTEELLLQSKANDKWSYYQAKNSRSHEMQGVADMLATVTVVDKEKAESLRQTYAKESARYDKEKEDASDQAREFEKEKDLVSRRTDRFDGAEAVLEIALIICSLTLLTKKRFYWLSGIALGAVGVLIALSGFLLHS